MLPTYRSYPLKRVPLSSTPPPLRSTPKTPQQIEQNSELMQSMQIIYQTPLRAFRCGTEGFWVMKRCGPCVEPMC